MLLNTQFRGMDVEMTQSHTDTEPLNLSLEHTDLDPDDNNERFQIHRVQTYSDLLVSDGILESPVIGKVPTRFPSLNSSRTLRRVRTFAFNFGEIRGLSAINEDAIGRTASTTTKLDAVLENEFDNNIVKKGSELDSLLSSTSEHEVHQDSFPQAFSETNEQALLRNDTAESDPPYTVFSSKMKVTIVFLATIAGCLNQFAQNIFYPSISIISADLHVTVAKTNYTVTAYIIFQAFTPLFVSVLSETHGRRPVYIVGLAIFLVANLGLVFSHNYIGLLLLRCLQSCGSSGLIALRSGTIADIVTRAEIGKYVAITSISSIVAPSLGPICGGLITQRFGWNAIFWFLLILTAIIITAILVWLPETCRSIVGNGSTLPPRWNRPLTNIFKERQSITMPPEREAVVSTFSRKKIDFLSVLTILSDPETILVVLLAGIISFGLSALSTSTTVQFSRVYGINSAQQGLLFLPQALGSIISACVNSQLLDYNFRRHGHRVGLHFTKRKQPSIGEMEQMPIEKARLQIVWPACALGAIWLILYGWSLSLRLHIAVPIIAMSLFSITMGLAFGTIFVLVVDLHQNRAATASAAASLIKCAFTAAASASVEPMLTSLGDGWTFTLIGTSYFAVLPLSWICMQKGIAMRKARRAKEGRRCSSAIKTEWKYMPILYRFTRILQKKTGS